MPKLDKACPGCNRSLPGDEIHPPVEVVRAELKQIRKEMASADWDTHRAHQAELSKAMRQYPDRAFERITRRISVAVFTAKQMEMGERILRDLEQKGRSVGDGRVV